MICENYYIGHKFGKLTVLSFEERKNGYVYYKCQCDCGQLTTVALYYLKNGMTRSCGCLRKENKSGTATLLKGKVDGTDLYAFKKGLSKNNKTGVKGVCWDKTFQKYCAYIGFQGKQIKLGKFNTLEEAKMARMMAEEKIYKPFLEQHNIKEILK